MARNKVIDRDLGMKSLERKIKGLNRLEAVAGLFDERNATIGTIQEFGAPEANIPSRPFMRAAFDSDVDGLTDAVADGVRAMIDGAAGASAPFDRFARKAASDITESIVGWSVPENAPLTVAKKGFNDPLIETGEMSRSVKGRTRSKG